MLRRCCCAAGCLLLLILLLALPCSASDVQLPGSCPEQSPVCLTAVSASSAEETSSAEEALPPKYEPENARRNIAITAGTVLLVVTAAAILIRNYKGY